MRVSFGTRFRFVFLLITLFFIFVIVVFASFNRYNRTLTNESEIKMLKHLLEDEINYMVSDVKNIEHFIESVPSDNYELYLDNYIQFNIESGKGIENISYAPNGIIEYSYINIDPSPIGRDLYAELDNESYDDVIATRDFKVITVSGALENENINCSSFVFHSPIINNGIVTGIVNVCFQTEYIVSNLKIDDSSIYNYDLYNQYDSPLLYDKIYNSDMFYLELVAEEVSDLRLGIEFSNDYLYDLKVNDIKLYSLISLFYVLILGITNFYHRKNLKNTNEKLFLMNFDTTSKLPNRWSFERDALHNISSNIHFKIIFININGLQSIRDTYGHKVGDEFNLEFISMINQELDDNMTLYYWGSGELILMVAKCNDFMVEELIELLNSVTVKPIIIRGIQKTLTYNAGVSSFPGDSSEYEELVMFADIAMYSSKDLGVINYNFYSSEIGNKFNKDMILNEVIENFDIDKIEVYLQPIVDSKSFKISSYEALFRYPSGSGFLNTQSIINYLEKIKRISEIDIIVFSIVCGYLKEMIKVNPNITIGFNLSPDSLNYETYYEIFKIFNKFSIPANNFTLEVTESIKFNDDNLAIEILNLYREIGFYIALDDFGSGYSSLNYLSILPVTHVKIDGKFVNNISKHSVKVLLESITKLSKELGFSLVAEGVETVEHLEEVLKLDIKYIQGYYFYKPMTFKAALSIILNDHKYSSN